MTHLNKDGSLDMRWADNKNGVGMTKRQLNRSILCAILLGALLACFLVRPRIASEDTLKLDIKQDYIDTNYPENFYERVPTIQPTPMLENMGIGLSKPIVKVAYAREYTFENHANKPYYRQIILALQDRYTNWFDAAELIGKESGFNPFAVNPTSGACGVCQSLPCAKMNCELSDIDCQLDWQWNYIANRYGTITKALAFHQINGWY